MEATVTISQEKYEALVEAKVKLDTLARYFEKDKYGMGREVFCKITGFDIPEED